MQRKRSKMASIEEKEIEKHLHIALAEVGDIKPWFDKRYKAWLFSHEAYPVEYAGDSSEEVIRNYPLYLKEFISHRLKGRLAPLMEKKTKGHGGARKGAGRPIGSKKEEHIRISLPKEIAIFLKVPGALDHLRGVLHSYRQIANR